MKRIDAHIHYVDFNQESDGFETLLREMDKARIERAVIFGLPVKKKWAYHEKNKPGYYLDGYSKCYYYTLTDEFLAHQFQHLSRDDQARFAPLLCGFDPTDRGSVSYLKYMLDKYPFWQGVGEILLRHDELSLHTSGELPRINHPCMHEVYDLCKKNGLPVLFHHNAQSVGYESKPIYVDEIREVLDNHNELQFIWAHAGASARTSLLDDYPNVIDELLTSYVNLSVDLSWKIYDQEILEEGGSPKSRYIALIERYPDRFMIGSDLTGHFEKTLSREIRKFDPLFETLSQTTQSRVAFDNAQRIYFQDARNRR